MAGGVEFKGSVLIVEDEPGLPDLLVDILGSYGCNDVTIGEDFRTGRKLLNTRYHEGRTFDLLLIDGYLRPLHPREHTLENLEGCLLAAQAWEQALDLKGRSSGLYIPLPVSVLLSANSHMESEEGRRYLRESGIVLAHNKPIGLEEIADLIMNIDLLRRNSIDEPLPNETRTFFSSLRYPYPSKWIVLA